MSRSQSQSQSRSQSQSHSHGHSHSHTVTVTVAVTALRSIQLGNERCEMPIYSNAISPSWGRISNATSGCAGLFDFCYRLTTSAGTLSLRSDTIVHWYSTKGLLGDPLCRPTAAKCTSDIRTLPDPPSSTLLDPPLNCLETRSRSSWTPTSTGRPPKAAAQEGSRGEGPSF